MALEQQTVSLAAVLYAQKGGIRYVASVKTTATVDVVAPTVVVLVTEPGMVVTVLVVVVLVTTGGMTTVVLVTEGVLFTGITVVFCTGIVMGGGTTEVSLQALHRCFTSMSTF